MMRIEQALARAKEQGKKENRCNHESRALSLKLNIFAKEFFSCFLFLFVLSFLNTADVLFGKGHTFLMRDLIKYYRFLQVNILYTWI